MAKDILSIVGQPLGKTEIPEAKDLTSFWASVERALDGLNENVDLQLINRRGCENIGPIILGKTAFNAIKAESFRDWWSFKAVVELHFGLSQEQLM